MRRDITLIETLVLVVVIVASLSMILPWCVQARITSRREFCLSNQREMAAAALAFEQTQGHFPGYKQKLAGRDVSWAVMLLPQLERSDLWKLWQAKPYDPQAQVRQSVMICPSDPPDSSSPKDGACSYAINTLVCPEGIGLDAGSIRDGIANTLLFSENLRKNKSHTWWDTDAAKIGFGLGTMSDNIESNHGDGAVAAFADGHVAFIRSDLGDKLYQALVTPNGHEDVPDGGL
jgi:prepilin-type processing-associated H-X9-DG protein